MDGDVSSEGIVASSDDEFDGLSRAVEHHIFRQETETPEPVKRDTGWKEDVHFPRLYDRDQLNYQEDMMPSFFDNDPSLRTQQWKTDELFCRRFAHTHDYNFAFTRRFEPPHPHFQPSFAESHCDDFQLRRSFGVPSRPLQRAPSPIPMRKFSPEPTHPHEGRKYPKDFVYEAFQSSSPTGLGYHRHGHSMMRRYGHTLSPFEEVLNCNMPPPEWNRRDSFAKVNQTLTANSALSHPGHSRRPYPQGSPRSSAEYLRDRSPLRTCKDLLPEKAVGNYNQSIARFSSSSLLVGAPFKCHKKPIPLDEHPHKPDTDPKRRNPPPVSFKIKQKTSVMLEKPHPLDPLSGESADWINGKSTSPAHWFHDKYEDSVSPENKRESSLRPRTRNSSDMERSEDSAAKLDDSKRPKMSLNKQKLVDENKPDSKLAPVKVESPEPGLIHSEREDRVVEEEEVILEEDVVDTASAEDGSLLESDDDELLGLRLQALTSALNMENRAKMKKPISTKKRGLSRKKRPKHMLRRGKRSPERMLKAETHKKSAVADRFLKKYNDATNYHHPEKLRILTEKSSAAQLTLFSEIVRNHQPISKAETLHHIGSLPEDSEKADMLLKFVRSNSLEESTAFDVIGQSVLQKRAGSTGESEEQTVKNVHANSQDSNKIDNYEEIEMDLEGDGSDTDLVPPGTDAKLIDPPLLLPQGTRSQCTPSRGDFIESGTAKHVTSKMLGTPSQESIWNMLESPLELKSQEGIEEKDLRSTIHKNEVGEFPFDEPEIDDDGLSLLRAQLLKQIDKSDKLIKRQEEQVLPSSDNLGVCPKNNPEAAPLTSPYPYQPPTLLVSHAAIKPQFEVAPTAETAFGTQLLDTKPSTKQQLHPSNLFSKEKTSRKGHLPIQSDVEAGSIVPLTPVVTVTPPLPLLKSGECQISSGVSVATPETPSLMPQMSSTTALVPGDTPIAYGQQKRLKPRRSRTRTLTQTGNVMLRRSMAKTPTKEKRKVLEIEDTGVEADIIPVALKPSHSAMVPLSLNDRRQSQTAGKTAKTIIKANTLPKTTFEVSAFTKTQLKQPVVRNRHCLEKPTPILPRHQPVVIELGGSSDDDESVLSPTKAGSPLKNPSEFHQDLDAMIKQVREQTTRKQIAEVRLEYELAQDSQCSKKTTSTAQLPSSSLSKFPVLQESKTSAHTNIKKPNRSLNQSTSKNPVIGSSQVPITASHKAKNHHRSVSQADLALGSSELLKQSRSKFLKLKGLIAKDVKAQDHLVKVKETKLLELKSVDKELKEMMYRVAAVKGKKARCEEQLRFYTQQEAKIKERIGKRNVLKSKLKEKVKQHWLKVRADKRVHKIVVENFSEPMECRRTETQELALQAISAKSSQSSANKMERLDQEKQRLLTVEKKLAKKINMMKYSEKVAPKTAASNSRRSSLSSEVRSHLAMYRDAKKSEKPSAHDLSLSKIAVPALSPMRPSPTKDSGTLTEYPSPNKKSYSKQEKEGVGYLGTLPVLEIVTQATVKSSKRSHNLNLPKSSERIEEDESMNLRRYISKSMADWINAFPAMSQYFPDVPYSSRVWEKRIPDCFKDWKLDLSETPTLCKEGKCNMKKYEYGLYKSPLRMFRSYRLSPFFRVKEKLLINSETFSHKINPRTMFCRYDVTGMCHDAQCKAQHGDQYRLAPGELLLDIMSYSPILFGKEAVLGLENSEMVKLSDSVCNGLFGKATAQGQISLDEKCIMLASKVNDALGSKPPYTTVLRPRQIKLKQAQDDLWTFIHAQDAGSFGKINAVEKKHKGLADSDSDDSERYFSMRDAYNIAVLEKGVRKSPLDIQLWLELSRKRMRQKSHSEHSRIELGLNTLCHALEENPYNGELWSQYLEIFHLPRAGQREEDLDEMISQAIEFVPLSTHVWNLLFSWNHNASKRGYLYDHLISNLMQNALGEKTVIHLNFEVASRWLLQTLLQRTQLEVLRNGVPAALLYFETTVKDVSQQCIQQYFASSRCTGPCLSTEDLNSLWMAYVNLKHFGTLPNCFFSNSNSRIGTRQSLGIVVRPHAEVRLQIGSEIGSEKCSEILSDVKSALKECCPSESYATSNCFSLLGVELNLEMALQKWENAALTCSLLSKNLYESICEGKPDLSQLQQVLTETLITWADALLRKGNCLEATQVFDDAVTKQPWNSRLCYEAALFQINLENADIDAAILYIETCVSAYLVTGDNLDKTQLMHYLRCLLGISVAASAQLPELASGITLEKVHQEKTYLWMMYCLLLEMTKNPQELIIESYEKAIEDVVNERDSKELMLRFLRFKQHLGSSITGLSVHLSRSRQSWLKKFSSLVRRCLLSVTVRENMDDVLSPHGHFYDYTFHNKVSSIYLSCFHSRQQMATAYHFLTELMPYNIPLLLRACQYFLTFGDHSTVISILLKVTSKAACQDKTVWKISIASHFLSGRIAKAIHISKQAVEAMPYSVELWSDYLACLRAYGTQDDFVSEKIRCSANLQADASRLLP